MSKRQANRLTEQQIRGGGPKEIFGEVARLHDDAVADASATTFSLLVKTYTELKFQMRDSIAKSEINSRLKSIDCATWRDPFCERGKHQAGWGIDRGFG